MPSSPDTIDCGPVLTDEQLFDAFRTCGDAQAFEELVRRYSGQLLLYILRYVHDEHHAQDALNNTFSKFWDKAPFFESGQKVLSWIYTIAKNEAIDTQRKINRLKKKFTNESDAFPRTLLRGNDADIPPMDALHCYTDDPIAALIREEKCSEVRLAIATLPEPQRRSVELYAQGKKLREIAEDCGIPLNTAKYRVYAGCRALRGTLASLMADEQEEQKKAG